MSLLFLGVGNGERGDDAVGPRLAERFEGLEPLRALGVDVISHGGEGASLMSLWEGLDQVVVVDAMMSHRKPGFIQRFDAVKETLGGGVFRYSSHLFGLAEATEMARQLHKLPKSLIIYGIEGASFDFGAPLSKPVAAAMKKVEAQVLADFGVATMKSPKKKAKAARHA